MNSQLPIQSHKQQIMKEADLESQLHHLRSKATELLLKQDFHEYINLYTHFISLIQTHHQQSPHIPSKPLSLALSNRAEAHYKLKNLTSALNDCTQALEIDPSHLKTLICKGKVHLDLAHYSEALHCFQKALFLNKNETLSELLGKCKKLDALSRNGLVDFSDWVVSGFCGKFPDLAEFVGSVEIRRGEDGRRGVFVTRSVEAGTVLVVTKAVVLGRGILPESGSGVCENARMVMWKDFVDRILDATEKCRRTLYLVYLLSSEEGGENELKIPDMGLFRPEAEEERFILEDKEPNVERILKILDVNCLNEEGVSSKVFGKKTSGYCGVGLWILPSFVNHSCSPNVRRLHIGDWLVVHASRDIKEGEEITFGYFDVLLPFNKRRELSKRWGFCCECDRCNLEEMCEGLRELEKVLESGSNVGEFVVRLEEEMKRSVKGKKEKGYLRASFWEAYSVVFESEKTMKRFGRKIPAELVVVESVMDAVGGDERVLKAFLGSLKRNGSSCGNRLVEMERMMKIGRGVYGKVVKKQGMKALFEQLNY